MPNATMRTKRRPVLACGKREAATMPGMIAAPAIAVDTPMGSRSRYPAAMPRTNGMANFIAGLLRNIPALLPDDKRFLLPDHLQNNPRRVRQIARPRGEC